jgi:hypothetical protein
MGKQCRQGKNKKSDELAILAANFGGVAVASVGGILRTNVKRTNDFFAVSFPVCFHNLTRATRMKSTFLIFPWAFVSKFRCREGRAIETKENF